VTSVVRFEAALLAELRSRHADVLAAIRDSKDLSDETRAKLKDALDGFVKTFA
jgi:F-type H+-transporting ATPase subunit alpha